MKTEDAKPWVYRRFSHDRQAAKRYTFVFCLLLRAQKLPDDKGAFSMKNRSAAMESLQSLETFFTSLCKDAVLSAHVQKHSQEIIDAMLHLTKK